MIKVAALAVQTTRRGVVRLAAQRPRWPAYLSVSRRAPAFRPSP